VPNLSKEQRATIRRALRVAKARGASPRVLKAMVETMAVESNYQHLDYGDRDSVGAFQQRPSQGWGSASDSLEKDTNDFLDRAIPANKRFRGSAGQLAQSVQRSAFPARYDERGGEASQILASYKGGGSKAPQRGSQPAQQQYTTQTTPGTDNSGLRRQLVGDFLQQGGVRNSSAVLGLAASYGQAADVPGTSTRVPVAGQQPKVSRPKKASSTGPIGGELKELFYNGPGGVNVDNGQTVPKGFVSGHTDHVHVAAGPRTVVSLGKLAQRMGLTVRENKHFDPVDPVHTEGSYHYRDQAIDVSGDPKKMAAYSRRVARLMAKRK
jgi:hypothetical protein